MDVGFITLLRADLRCQGGLKSLCSELKVFFLVCFSTKWRMFWKLICTQTGLCSRRACSPLAPTFPSWVTKKSWFFFVQIICWAPPEILQFQSTGLPLIFLRAQPCLHIMTSSITDFIKNLVILFKVLFYPILLCRWH